ILIKVWSGYEKEGFLTDDEETVYITETGLVYHRDYHCTHLELSIRMVSSAELESLRNNSGGRYYPCGQCVRLGKNGVYITNTGDRYHSSLSCSGLKRTIYAVPVSEAVGRRACSRCGK
ncbi:MAG: pilus assembly protein, partial [Lachnospiraceae bacterium]|nr:pilus assembly protein [Lachnospiraceae bacterium]